MEASQGNDPDAVNRIRQLESEISQNILIARRQADKNISDAHLQAKNLCTKAITTGINNGEETSRTILKEAEKKASFLLEKAREEAVRLSNPTQETVDRLARKAVDFICGKQN